LDLIPLLTVCILIEKPLSENNFLLGVYLGVIAEAESAGAVDRNHWTSSPPPANLPAFGSFGHLTTANKNTTRCDERSTLLTISLVTVETLIDAI
jgi:hypothetical protein